MNGCTKMRTADFDYHLPERLIAQHPPETRGTCRMLVLDRVSGKCEIRKFSNLPDYLSPGDCAVFNNTKVIPARLFGQKSTGAKIEIMLLRPEPENPSEWRCLLRPRKRLKPGTEIILSAPDPKLPQEVVIVAALNDDGSGQVRFTAENVQKLLDDYGHMPLPPYIRRHDENADRERYQTVFAREPGAVAAPTAGLHFTPEIISRLDSKGVKRTEVTLHVGAGTFKPVDAENIDDHKMHTETYTLPESVADIINNTHTSAGKVMAVGTTSVRVLETCADNSGKVIPGTGATDIFIHPPYQPKIPDMLLTNFHLPRSTLLMLVSAFAGRKNVLAAYERAKQENFRFYSYGDCMLLK